MRAARLVWKRFGGAAASALVAAGLWAPSGLLGAGEPAASLLDRYGSAGPFKVGVRTAVYRDESREDPYTKGGRTLVTSIWYPADPGDREYPRATFTSYFEPHPEAGAAFVEHFGGRIDEVERRFGGRALQGAPRAAGRFPLLVFSHGNGGVRHQNVFQVEHLASHGYVVAACDHTGNAGVTPLPDRALPYDRSGRARSAADRPRDVMFLVTRLLEESRDPHSWLHGALDPAHVGVLGHSFGGYTACRVAALDRRVGAILPMTVAAGEPCRIPLLAMLGAKDRTMGAAGNVAAGTYYAAARGPKHLVTFIRGGHFTFTDMDAINPDYGDGIGKDPKTGEAFIDTRLAKRLINAYSLAFFERYLRYDLAADRVLQERLSTSEVRVAADNLERVAAREAGTPALLAGFVAGRAAPPSRPARVLIVTGDDVPAHDWRRTTPVTRSILEGAGFEVRVVEDAGILETSALRAYDAVCLNYRNAPARDPGPAAREGLSRFVREGGGLVALHFAVNAFQDWPEREKLLGRVWVGRRAGKKISGHGPRGPFKVRVVRRDHPITAGLEDFETDDELYSRLVGEAPIEVLCEAHSAWSGRNEPVAWTLRYGKGRVFVTVLGHDVRARENAGFRHLLARGTAWAAGR